MFYYLGRFRTECTLKDVDDISIDDHIGYSLNKENAKIIIKMKDKIYDKIKKLLLEQLVNDKN